MPNSIRSGMNPKLSIALLALTLGAATASGQAPPNGALPDVIGIRPGMPIGEAYQLLKAHDPKGAILYGQKRIEGISEKPITHAFLYSPRGSGEDPEIIVVDVTFPPNQQTVWRVSRFLRIEPGKEPLPETLLAALRQKYGHEVPNTVPQNFYWVFDERGNPADRSGNLNLSDCAIYVEYVHAPGVLAQTAGAASSPNVPSGVALNPTAVVANRDACHPFVYVRATFTPKATDTRVIEAVGITITDLGAGIRAGTATQALMGKAGEAQQRQAIDHAKKQSAPTF